MVLSHMALPIQKGTHIRNQNAAHSGGVSPPSCASGLTLLAGPAQMEGPISTCMLVWREPMAVRCRSDWYGPY